jgi:hypothetical protein
MMMRFSASRAAPLNPSDPPGGDAVTVRGIYRHTANRTRDPRVENPRLGRLASVA